MLLLFVFMKYGPDLHQVLLAEFLLFAYFQYLRHHGLQLTHPSLQHPYLVAVSNSILQFLIDLIQEPFAVALVSVSIGATEGTAVILDDGKNDLVYGFCHGDSSSSRVAGT